MTKKKNEKCDDDQEEEWEVCVCVCVCVCVGLEKGHEKWKSKESPSLPLRFFLPPQLQLACWPEFKVVVATRTPDRAVCSRTPDRAVCSDYTKLRPHKLVVLV